MLGRLGTGGAAEVWEAEDALSGERIAVKLFSEATAPAWRSELLALQRLDVPGVIRLRDSGFEEHTPYLVLDRVDGAHFPGLPIPCAWEALAPRLGALLQTLAHVHARGALHGDLKPENVLVNPVGRLTVIDLGLARLREAPSDLDGGDIQGSPPWIAPEVVGGLRPSARSDLFVVGMMAWVALTGALPWQADNPFRLLDQMRTQPLPSLRAPLGAPPPGAEQLLRALLSVAPANRPESALSALHLLERALPALDDLAWPTGPVVDESAYRGLFWGPERVLHLQSDAASALYRRVGGDLEAARRELRRWVWAAQATQEGDRLRVQRRALAELRACEDRRLDAAPARPLERRLSPGLEGLLVLVGLAGEHATPDVLSRASRLNPEQVAAQLRTLRDQDQIFWEPGQVAVDRTGGATLSRWDAIRLSDAHARLAAALPERHPDRIRHLLSADDLRGAAAEAMLLAEASREEGRVEEALALLLRAATWLQAEGELPLPERLCAALTCAAVATEQVGPLEQARAVLTQGGAPDALLALIQAAAAGLEGDEAARRRAELALPKDFQDPELELWRAGVRVRLAGRSSVAAHQRLLDELARDWAGDDPARRASLAGWQGQLHYRAERYGEAARSHLESARLKTRPNNVASSLLGAASSWLEAGQLDEAGRCAAEAEAIARRGRLTHFEARSVWIHRAARWRAGAAATVDAELVEVARRLRERDIGGLLLLTEAGIAWRGGAKDAARLASEAERAFHAIGFSAGVLLAGAVRCVADGDAQAAAKLARDAESCGISTVAIQALGLLAPLLKDRARWEEVARARVDPAQDPALRLEVLSVAEALMRLSAR